MKYIIWISLDLLLATIIAVLGNIVAAYLQEWFSLTDPIRFVLVTSVFVISLA